MNGPIVTGFDGSPESVSAAHWAARESMRRKLPLELLQAWPWREPHVLGTEDAVRWGRQQLARQEVELRARLSGVEVSAVHIPQPPAAALEAAGRSASMLVLGSRGLGALRGFLIGSVSQEVLAAAACPVVLVRADDGGAFTDGSGVVLALDLSHPGEAVVDFAFEAAALRSAPLRVVHAWEPPMGSEFAVLAAFGSLEQELAVDAAQRLTEALEPWRAKYPQVRVEAGAVHGPAAREVVEAAAGAGLVVVGRRARRAPVGLHLGTVTQAVVHHVHAPVAVVPFG
ncbi:universal stress protein [Kitasatospora sp. NPDC002227]|uniref:universal stress protein n=1 Tax=Kitasatospora sp. NPDC002227 TaxID=3154773 RepID=UPI0033328D33